MLTIRNKHELRENAVVIPLIEQVALCASAGSVVRRISGDQGAPGIRSGWIIFQNREARGFGINLAECVLSATSLRRRLLQVRQAQKLARSFMGPEGLPLYWTTTEECPEAWRIFRAEARMGTFMCATSSPPPTVMFQGMHVQRVIPKVRLTLVAYLYARTPLVAESTIQESRFCVEFIGQRLWGELFVAEGGIVKIESTTASEISLDSQRGIVIRVDLGQIELPLDQLMAIRVGGVIELDAAMPMRCFMSVGDTTLAEGELSITESGVSIKVTDLLA